MLKAYFDDSGTHNEAAFYVMAGYVAPIEVWLSFEKQWRAVLAAEPAIEYFHGNECFSRSKQFAGFEQADAVAKVYYLVDSGMCPTRFRLRFRVPLTIAT